MPGSGFVGRLLVRVESGVRRRPSSPVQFPAVRVRGRTGPRPHGPLHAGPHCPHRLRPAPQRPHRPAAPPAAGSCPAPTRPHRPASAAVRFRPSAGYSRPHPAVRFRPSAGPHRPPLSASARQLDIRGRTTTRAPAARGPGSDPKTHRFGGPRFAVPLRHAQSRMVRESREPLPRAPSRGDRLAARARLSRGRVGPERG